MSDNDYADIEELTVRRDETGELLPVDKHTSLGRIQVYPMAYGAVERHFGDGDVADIDSDKIADLLDEYVVEPDLAAYAADAGYDGVTGAFVREELKPLVPRDILMAILEASGVEADVMMDDDGGAQVAVDQGNPP